MKGRHFVLGGLLFALMAATSFARVAEAQSSVAAQGAVSSYAYQWERSSSTECLIPSSASGNSVNCSQVPSYLYSGASFTVLNKAFPYINTSYVIAYKMMGSGFSGNQRPECRFYFKSTRDAATNTYNTVVTPLPIAGVTIYNRLAIPNCYVVNPAVSPADGRWTGALLIAGIQWQ